MNVVSRCFEQTEQNCRTDVDSFMGEGLLIMGMQIWIPNFGFRTDSAEIDTVRFVPDFLGWLYINIREALWG